MRLILFLVRYFFDNCETANIYGDNFIHYMYQPSQRPY